MYSTIWPRFVFFTRGAMVQSVGGQGTRRVVVFVPVSAGQSGRRVRGQRDGARSRCQQDREERIKISSGRGLPVHCNHMGRSGVHELRIRGRSMLSLSGGNSRWRVERARMLGRLSRSEKIPGWVEEGVKMNTGRGCAFVFLCCCRVLRP